MITHVAIKYKGVIYLLPKPNRHHDVIRLIANETGEESIGPNIQGFIDDKRGMVTRKLALAIARKAGQLLNPNDIRCGMLFSEDVW